jgi:hypothetical protein
MTNEIILANTFESTVKYLKAFAFADDKTAGFEGSLIKRKSASIAQIAKMVCRTINRLRKKEALCDFVI